MQVALPFVLLALSVLPSFALLRSRQQRLARAFGWLLLVAIAGLPWLAGTWPALRFFVGLGAVLTSARLAETLLGHAPARATRSLWSYFAFYFSVAEWVYSTTQEEARSARRAALGRFGRGLLKVGALLGCFALSTALPGLHSWWPLHALWCLYAAYLAFSGGTDLYTAAWMVLTGDSATEVFRAPPLATSPRDFWSRRWNAMFRNTAHRIVFTPLGGATRPLLSVSAVFLASALVHEYLMFAALGYSEGHMLAFFTLHGAATLITGARRTPWPVPRGLDVLLHSTWLVLTAPLFFAPMEQVFPVSGWRLW
jgi:Membrane bound O-acyl transferase family